MVHETKTHLSMLLLSYYKVFTYFIKIFVNHKIPPQIKSIYLVIALPLLSFAIIHLIVSFTVSSIGRG